MTDHPRQLRTLVAGVFVIAALAAACGSGEPGTGGAATNDAGGGVSAGMPAPGGGLTVDEAIARGGSGTPIAVHGFLIDDGASVRMCAAVAESYPPQCGGGDLQVEGVDVAARADATIEGDIAWVDDARLVGVFDGSTLLVDGTSI